MGIMGLLLVILSFESQNEVMQIYKTPLSASGLLRNHGLIIDK